MRLEDIKGNSTISWANLKADQELVRQIQTKLNVLNLYPGGSLIDGIYGPRTEAALIEFCNAENLPNMRTGIFDERFAQTLLMVGLVPLRLEDLKGNTTIALNALKANAQLLEEIQIRLSAIGLYPGGRWIDGKYGPRTEASLIEFCNIQSLPNMKTGVFDQRFAQALLNVDAVPFLLEKAKDRGKIFNEFLAQEQGLSVGSVAFLYRGINNSPYQKEIKFYPDRLKEKPDEIEVISLGKTATVTGTNKTVSFNPYPRLGELPQIDETGLNFLHQEIQQACICIGSFVEGKIQARWLGRNALSNVECWSSTKIIPLLNVVSQVNSNSPATDIDNCLVRAVGSQGGFPFHQLAADITSYQNKIANSNTLGVTFKQFNSPENLEDWVKKITGNKNLTFRGRYGQLPFIQSPQLFDQKLKKVVLTAGSPNHRGSNSISLYDLARFASMLGWHHHFFQEGRLPGAQWDSLESVVRAMGKDAARYVEVAINKLGLESVIRSPVIISKLGNGRSSIRDRYEIVYVALVQFVDKRPKSEGKPAKLRTLSMALLAAKDLNNPDREAKELDARMAAEVTEILRRVVTEELI